MKALNGSSVWRIAKMFVLYIDYVFLELVQVFIIYNCCFSLFFPSGEVAVLSGEWS
jgi:hypothetical protein